MSAEAQQSPLEAALQQLPDTKSPAPDRDALLRFYQGREFHPVFADEMGLTRAANLIAGELAHAADWGFDAAEFPTDAIHAPMAANRWSSNQVAAAELQIATGLLKYAHQARGGRIADPTNLLSANLDRRPVVLDPATVLADVTASPQPDALLRSYQPQHEQFRRLKEVNVKLAAAKPRSADQILADKGPLLVPGGRSAEVETLRKRLSIVTSAEPQLYDDALVTAVKAAQKAGDLDDDGIVGPATRKLLNGGKDDEHLKTIRANMELWRWMPAELGTDHLFVNVPSFTIDLVENGLSKLQERVIVGKPKTPTPIFSKTLTTIVLRPSWNLPNSIKLEKLRSAQRRGGAVEDEGYRIMKGKREVKSWSVDWERADLSVYQFVQPSGEGNALGNVKFLFPNRHSVYLHDTPSKSLFNTSDRLYSHGCVRLRNPLTLAQMLLDEDKGKGTLIAAKLAKSGPSNNEIKLDKPLPIHIGYFTAWVKNDGETDYFDDFYGHVERVTLALEKKWKDIDREEAAEEVDTSELKSVAPARQRLSTSENDAAPVRRPAPAGMMRVFGERPEPKARKAQYMKPLRARRDSVGDMIRSALGAP